MSRLMLLSIFLASLSIVGCGGGSTTVTSYGTTSDSQNDGGSSSGGGQDNGGGSQDNGGSSQDNGGSSQDVPPVIDISGAGSATVNWDAPNTDIDGTCTTDLAGYMIHVGDNPGSYGYTIDVAGSNLACTVTSSSNACGFITSCSYTIDNIAETTWYMSIQAYDYDNNAGPYSNEAVVIVNSAS